MELVETLLGEGFRVVPTEIFGGEEGAQKLLERLIIGERYSLAKQVCVRYGLPTVPLWMAWGQSLLRTGEYSLARDKFRLALREARDARLAPNPPRDLPEPLDLVNSIVQALESSKSCQLEAAVQLCVLSCTSSCLTVQ